MTKAELAITINKRIVFSGIFSNFAEKIIERNQPKQVANNTKLAPNKEYGTKKPRSLIKA